MSTAPGRGRVYRSIFLESDWAHQRYFGWDVDLELSGVRLLRRRRGPLVKNLVLLTSVGHEHLGTVLKKADPDSRLSEVVIHDFDQILADPPSLWGLRWRRAAATERLLNIATIAIDLTLDEDALLKGMNSNYRREIRQAQEDGVRVHVHDRPPDALLERFTSSLANLATERGFDHPQASAIRRMFEGGNSLLVVAARDGEEINYVHLYLASASAYFMSGVNLSRASDGAGKLIHWTAMRRLKSDGYEWYDLGGVRSRSSDDGIYNFKRRFGGQFISLGTEWRHGAPVSDRGLEFVKALRRRNSWRKKGKKAYDGIAR